MKDRCRDPWVVQSPATDRERQVLAVLVCHSTPVGRFVLTVHPFNRTCNKEFVASRAGKGSRRGKVQHTLGYCWRTLSLCLLPLHAVERAGVRPPPFGSASSILWGLLDAIALIRRRRKMQDARHTDRTTLVPNAEFAHLASDEQIATAVAALTANGMPPHPSQSPPPPRTPSLHLFPNGPSSFTPTSPT